MKANKLIYIGIVIIIFLLTFLVFKLINKEKIAYVDTIKLIQNYKGMKTAIADYELKEKEMNARVDTLRSELELKIKDYEKAKPSLNSKARLEEEEVLIKRKNQYLQYKQAIEEKIKEDKKEISEKVLTPVDAFVKEYGKTHGYKIIFGTTNMGNIVYADSTLDITDKILKELNK